jgi:hypothetical protein
MTDPLLQMQAQLQRNQGGNSAMDALQQGMQTGLLLQQIDQQKRDAQLAQNAMIRRNVMLQQLTSTPPAQRTAQMYADYASYHPQEAESMRKNWEVLDKDSKDDALRFAGQAMSLDSAGRTEDVNQMFNDRAEQERLQGNDEMAQYYSKMATMPSAQRTAALGIMASSVPEGKEMLTSVFKAQNQPGELTKQRLDNEGKSLENKGKILSNKISEENFSTLHEKNGLELEQKRSEIEKNRQSTGTANRAEQRQMVADKVEARNLKNSIDQTNNLIATLDDPTTKMSNNPEWVSEYSEGVKRFFGKPDEASKFKQNYREWRQKAMAALFKGQGAISDAERAAFDKVYPNENAPIPLIKSALKHHLDVLSMQRDAIPIPENQGGYSGFGSNQGITKPKLSFTHGI